MDLTKAALPYQAKAGDNLVVRIDNGVFPVIVKQSKLNFYEKSPGVVINSDGTFTIQLKDTQRTAISAITNASLKIYKDDAIIAFGSVVIAPAAATTTATTASSTTSN
jgi:hypothetical protein